ncbi:MAG: hypothetical protein SFU27_03675 [Thermonemataceae bacterium]|nr:hypothetical protein [Thermonemataceae bacterium]
MIKNSLIIALLTLLVACNPKESDKIDLSGLKMSADTTNKTVVSYKFSVRFDCGSDANGNADQSALDIDFQNDGAFKNRYFLLTANVEKIFHTPIEDFPPLADMNASILSFLSDYQGKASYQDFSNYLLHLAVKGYFKRLPSLSTEDKIILGNYVDILVAQKNMELTELTWALEKLQSYWSSQKIKSTAAIILTQYESYYRDSGMETELNTIKLPEGTPSEMTTTIEEMKQEFEKDKLAIPTLTAMSQN